MKHVKVLSGYGVLCMQVEVDQDFLFDPNCKQEISREMTDKYKEGVGDYKDKSCVLVIAKDYACGTFDAALFDLWEEVKYNGGVLRIVNYPKYGIDRLNALGLTVLPGFKLYDTIEGSIEGGIK